MSTDRHSNHRLMIHPTINHHNHWMHACFHQDHNHACQGDSKLVLHPLHEHPCQPHVQSGLAVVQSRAQSARSKYFSNYHAYRAKCWCFSFSLSISNLIARKYFVCHLFSALEGRDTWHKGKFQVSAKSSRDCSNSLIYPIYQRKFWTIGLFRYESISYFFLEDHPYSTPPSVRP